MAKSGVGFTGLKLDRAGVGEILKSSEVAGIVNDVAYRVAADTRRQIGGAAGRSTSIRRQAPVVVVTEYTRDRRGAVVTVQHFNAVALAAKYGILVDAVPGAQGINLTERRWGRR